MSKIKQRKGKDMRELTVMEYSGISHGLGALVTAKRIRRIQEGKNRLPTSKEGWGDQEYQVARVNKYFEEKVPTEIIDGTVK
jgi:hypothetical protein